MSNETDSSWSGFYRYDTTRFKGFSEALISNMERILLRMRESPPLYDMLTFYNQIDEHLTATDPHDFAVNQITYELIQQLYEVYKNLGYDGSIEDMLSAVLKNITIADVESIMHSATRFEAINTIGWKLLADRHLYNVSAHRGLFDVLRIQDRMFYPEPTWHFNYTFKEFWDSYRTDGYTLANWNPYEGTLFMEFSLNDLTIDATLWTLYLQYQTFIFKVCPVEGKQSLIIIDNNREIVSTPVATNMEIPCIERLVFTYDNQAHTLYWRTLLDGGMIENITMSPGVYFTMTAPLQEQCDAATPAVIRLLSYYPRKMETDQTLILL